MLQNILMGQYGRLPVTSTPGEVLLLKSMWSCTELYFGCPKRL